MNFLLVVVTNQSGIGRGYFTFADLERVHGRLEDFLAVQGVRFAGIYVCPHRAEDGCSCRKPETNLAIAASRDHGFELSRSVVIGDKRCDVDLGHRIGARSILVRTGYGRVTELEPDVRPHFVADGLSEAAEWIIRQGAREANNL